jgi:hypothetical protein
MSNEAQTQLMTTRTSTVVFRTGARHMANGDRTVCGFQITDEDYYDGNILNEPRRLSCTYCARQATHPLNVSR